MRISHKFKFIYFSNPKTGSESIRELLNPISEVFSVPYRKTTADNPFYSHIRPIELKSIFIKNGWNFDEYFKFTFVRNPYDRLISLYRMIKKNDPFFDLSFTDWVLQTLPDGSGGGGEDHQRWRKYGTYTIRAFAGDEAGNLMVDEVYRLEDISLISQTLRSKNLPVSISGVPWVNKNLNQASEKYWSPHLIEFVNRRYEYEIMRFGYDAPTID